MKFLVNGGEKNSRLLQIILLFTLFYVLLLWITNILIYTERIGFDFKSVVEYYRGSEESFRNPISYLGLLEITHIHIFLFAMALLLVNHLTAFLRLHWLLKLLLILVSFISGLMDIGSGWLIRYASPTFAYLKMASFILFQASFFILAVLSFFSLDIYKGHRDDRGNRGGGSQIQ